MRTEQELKDDIVTAAIRLRKGGGLSHIEVYSHKGIMTRAIDELLEAQKPKVCRPENGTSGWYWIKNGKGTYPVYFCMETWQGPQGRLWSTLLAYECEWEILGLCEPAKPKLTDYELFRQYTRATGVTSGLEYMKKTYPQRWLALCNIRDGIKP